MVNSRFEYVKSFEREEILLPATFIVVRIDGRGFTLFCNQLGLRKPIDDRLVGLMNKCALNVMENFAEIAIAFGESDEYSFIFKKSSSVFNRRRDKIITTMVSLFSSAFVFHWSEFFDFPLPCPPAFDSRAVLYPDLSIVRDYLSWRQADTHINCLYNYTLCVLLSDGIAQDVATEMLRGTDSAQKNEILFQHGVNYSFLPESHRKGSIILRRKKKLIVTAEDLIGDAFWKANRSLFEDEKQKP